MMKTKNKKINSFSSLHLLEKKRKKVHLASWFGLFLFFIGSFVAVNQNIGFLRVSVLSTVQHAPFDGTALPIEKTPDWVHLSSTEYKLDYDQIPSEKILAIPSYDAQKLLTPTANLQWNNAADNMIRNAKITYSVPYMGSYRLNGKENDGSHLAVDIKIPEKTPVHAIANGVVVKVSQIDSGFGKHVVVQHNNVPSFENPNQKIVLYSTYNHLGSIGVTEGQVVTKGQIIAQSGSTGFATTPHLHFQIDREDAPWHPYWPFTYKESSDAGLDFVGAVNAGLGKEKGLLMTVNPLVYVQKYQNFTPSAEPVTPPSSAPAQDSPSVTSVSRFEFSHMASYAAGESVTMKIFARDASGNNVTNFDGDVILMITGNVGTLPKASLNAKDFTNGEFSLTLQDAKAGTGQLIVMYQGSQFSTQNFTVSGSAPANAIAPSAETPPTTVTPVTPAVTPPVSEPVKPEPPKASSPEVKMSYRGKLFADVNGSHPNYQAIAYLKKNLILKGYEDGTFQPDRKVSRVEALKILIKGAERPVIVMNPAPYFKDTNKKAWYWPFIMTAYQSNIAQGYLDDTFHPDQSVTRAEFLKMMLVTLGAPLDPRVAEKPFEDVPTDAWFAPYVVYAKNKNLLSETMMKFDPEEAISREEVAEILYRALVIRETKALAYSSVLVMQ